MREIDSIGESELSKYAGLPKFLPREVKPSKAEQALIEAEKILAEDIASGKIGFEELKSRVEQGKSWSERMLAVKNLGRFQSPEAAAYLEKLYDVEIDLTKDSGEYLEGMKFWPNYESEMDAGAWAIYKDTVIHALAENGKDSEDVLLKIFEHLKQAGIAKADEFEPLDEEGDTTFDRAFLDENYFRKERIIEALGEVGSEKTTDALIEFIKEGGVFIYKKEIADALSKIDPERAAHGLLGLLKDKNPQVRKDAGKILYRLELGQIGISEEGVKYLERLYDLGEYNNPDFFVQRLTADGDIGVFDEEKKLAGYFSLGNPGRKEKVVRTKVLDFTYNTLFTPRDNEPPEERARREQVLEEFKNKYFEFYNQEFFAQSGVRINNLSFREQGWFLHFAINADEQRKAETKDFVRRYGEDGLRTFLSLEYGDDMGGQILKIGNGLPEKAAQAIFLKYGQIIDSVRDVERLVGEKFGLPKGLSPKAMDKIGDNLLVKGRDLLIEFGQKSELAGEKIPPELIKKILSELSNIRAEIILFASTFREAAKDPGFSAQEFVEKAIEIKDSSELSQEDKKQMIEIFVANRPEFSREVLSSDQKDFQRVLDEGGHEFRILRQNNHIVAFLRLDKLSNGNIYAGSFNLSPDARRTSIAIAMAKMAVEDVGSNHEIEAICYSKNRSLLQFYKRMLGFKEVGKTNEGDPEKEEIKLLRSRTGQPVLKEKAA